MMALQPSKPRRKSIRLKNYDYSTPGFYFVTICTEGRRCLLGEINDGKMKLNSLGESIQKVWMDLPKHQPGVELDTFVVMPNHLHGILILNVGVTFMAPHGKSAVKQRSAINRAPTLGGTIRRFKALSTRLTHQSGSSSFAWQRNYYEHIIRRDESLEKIRKYIERNPLKWGLDEENPINIPSPPK